MQQMANDQVIYQILDTTKDMLIYAMPIIGVMAGLMLILSFLYAITIGAVKKMF